MHRQELAVPAGHQQQEERIGQVLGQARREGVALQMVHRHQRQAAGQGDRLARRKAHHHPAHQARPGGGGDSVQVREARASVGHGLADDGLDDLDVGAGGDLRHHPAIGGVGLDLARHHRGQHVWPAGLGQPDHRRGRLVAAGLDAKHRQAVHECSRSASLLGAAWAR